MLKINPKKRNPDRTICEVLRQAYRRAEGHGDEEMKALIDEAHGYAKRMNAKLRQYREDWDEGLWRKND
jgi:hypothetical protein